MTVPSGLRMPVELRDAVARAAEADERTTAAEIRYLVKLGLERRERDKATLLESGQARELAQFIKDNQGAQEAAR